jgi:hypothetical protein
MHSPDKVKSVSMYLHHLQGVFSYMAKVTKSVKLIKLKDSPKDGVNTSKRVGVLYGMDIIVNMLCICWSKQ